jgi:small subunit ribosomal protein S24e
MDIVVVSKRDNILLGRTEVRFRIVHTKEKTPDRDSVREKLAAILNEKKETVIIDSMKSQFGKPESLGYAKVYTTKEKAMRVERDRTLVRNRLKERKVKEAKGKVAAPKAEAPKEKAAAPKAEAPKEKAAAPKAEAPKEKAAAPKAEVPKEKTPAPKAEAPKSEHPKDRAPAPKAEEKSAPAKPEKK